MSAITTHVLDTGRGRPAADMAVQLEYRVADGEWQSLASGRTNADGRITDLLARDVRPERGVYRLNFDVGGYYRTLGEATFYPEVTLIFEIDRPEEHYHVPLLLNAFGYSTYRGS